MKRGGVLSKLVLDTGVDMPYTNAQIMIHQPTVRELSLIGGEQTMLIACDALTRNYQNFVDDFDESEATNFDIIMTIINKKTEDNKISVIKQSLSDLFFILFPKYNVVFTPRSIIFQEDTEQGKINHMIDSSNFEGFADIIYDIFCLIEFEGSDTSNYNPSGPRAAALVEKFKKKKEYLAQLKRERGEAEENLSLLQRYISVLAVGEQKNKNELSDYTVFQLMEEYKRYLAKEEFDFTVQAKLAGATKIKDAKDWMDNIQFGNYNEQQ